MVRLSIAGPVFVRPAFGVTMSEATLHPPTATRPPARPSGLRRIGLRPGGSLWPAALAAAIAACGCHAVERPIALPTRHTLRSEQLLVLSDFKLQKDHPLIRELSTLREQVAGILHLPLERDPVVVYLFNTETDYRRYMAVTFPKLPPRSAYFVATPTELAVYTHWGANVREDLRHEYTHGLLHSAIKKVPLWLDEGLAEYFEVAGPRPGGVNREHARHLSEAVAAGWHPDLKRLERLDESAALKRADYQESWAWIHFLLNSTPEAKEHLLAYLGELRTKPDARPLSQRLSADVPQLEARFTGYVMHLTGAPQAVSSL
jgi:hypothetical protein